jgi:hypothetical protein
MGTHTREARVKERSIRQEMGKNKYKGRYCSAFKSDFFEF